MQAPSQGGSWPQVEGASAVDILGAHAPVWAKMLRWTLIITELAKYEISQISNSEQELTGDVSEMQG